MKKAAWLALVVVATLGSQVRADGWRTHDTELKALNLHLQGKVIDHTANHGFDRRIWSRVLGKRRDLYVYLPPNFDPHLRYPLMLVLHGVGQDERMFLDLVRKLDRAIRDGTLPPLIAAAPDGTLSGEPHAGHAGSLFLNTNFGDYEDYLLNDVWDFIVSHYPIRCERGAHVLLGVSTGGFTAYELAMRHRYAFGTVIGISPALNLRWVNDKGYYLADFDPHHWGWRLSLDPHREPSLLLNHSTHAVRLFNDFLHMYANPEEALRTMSCLNPIELVDRTKLRCGELEMYVGYGGRDELNFDAQVESFLYLAHFRRLNIGVGYDPDGHHDIHTFKKLLPGAFYWLGPRLQAYGPCACGPDGCPAPSAHQVLRPNAAAKVTAKSSPGARTTTAGKDATKSNAEFLPEPELSEKEPVPMPKADELGPRAGPPLGTFTPFVPLPGRPKVLAPQETPQGPPSLPQGSLALPPVSLPPAPVLEGPPPLLQGTPPVTGSPVTSPGVGSPSQPPQFLPEPGPALGTPPAATSSLPRNRDILQTKGIFYPWQ